MEPRPGAGRMRGVQDCHFPQAGSLPVACPDAFVRAAAFGWALIFV